MGVYEPINIKIKGQLKPIEDWKIFRAKLQLLCAEYDLDIEIHNWEEEV